MSNGAGSNGGIATWHYLVLIWGAAVALSATSIWLGTLSGQIGVNTKRLDKLEDFADKVREHDANTTAEQRNHDARMERLERLLGMKAAPPFP